MALSSSRAASSLSAAASEGEGKKGSCSNLTGLPPEIDPTISEYFTFGDIQSISLVSKGVASVYVGSDATTWGTRLALGRGPALWDESGEKVDPLDDDSTEDCQSILLSLLSRKREVLEELYIRHPHAMNVLWEFLRGGKWPCLRRLSFQCFRHADSLETFIEDRSVYSLGEAIRHGYFPLLEMLEFENCRLDACITSSLCSALGEDAAPHAASSSIRVVGQKKAFKPPTCPCPRLKALNLGIIDHPPRRLRRSGDPLPDIACCLQNRGERKCAHLESFTIGTATYDSTNFSDILTTPLCRHLVHLHLCRPPPSSSSLSRDHDGGVLEASSTRDVLNWLIGTHAPQLQSLRLVSNGAADARNVEHAALLKKAFSSIDIMPNIVDLHLTFENDLDCVTLAVREAIANGGRPKLKNLSLCGDELGRNEVMALMTGIHCSPQPPSLEELDLSNTHALSHQDMEAIAQVIDQGLCPNLRKLRLGGAGVQDSGILMMIHVLASTNTSSTTSAAPSAGPNNQGSRRIPVPPPSHLSKKMLHHLDFQGGEVRLENSIAELANYINQGLFPNLQVLNLKSERVHDQRAILGLIQACRQGLLKDMKELSLGVLQEAKALKALGQAFSDPTCCPHLVHLEYAVAIIDPDEESAADVAANDADGVSISQEYCKEVFAMIFEGRSMVGGEGRRMSKTRIVMEAKALSFDAM